MIDLDANVGKHPGVDQSPGGPTMIRFADGPAEGCCLSLRRSPIFLRVVRSRNGKWDALDMPDDEPKPTERVYAYYKVRDGGGMYWKFTQRSESGFYPDAEYKLCEEQPTDEEIRDRERWAAWAEVQRDKLRQQHPTV